MADGGFSIQEWMQKAKADPKVAGQPVIAVVAIFFLAFRFLYSPQQLLLTKELKKEKAISAEITGFQNAVANIEDIKVTVNDLRKAWSEIERRCYLKAEAPAFLQDLRALAKKAGIDLKNLSPQPSVTKTYETLTYEIYPVRITFTGTFKELGIFFRTMETATKTIFLDLPSLEPNPSGTFKLELIPTTLLLEEKPADGAAPPPPK